MILRPYREGDAPALAQIFYDAVRQAAARKGFVVLRRRDFEVNGVAIHNYAMEKRL